MDLLQLVFSFVNAPLFATFFLDMFWKRNISHGTFWGLLSGTCAQHSHTDLQLLKGKEAESSTSILSFQAQVRLLILHGYRLRLGLLSLH